MRVVLAILLCSCFGLCDTIADTSDNGFTLYLVRHAEKEADGSRDPVLTQTGKDRSEKLGNWFTGKDLKEVWSSDYTRTRDTAKPMLAQLGLTLSIYDPGDQTELVKQLLEQQHNALVVGHSNTIPELARLLCQCTVTDIDESEHYCLIVI